MCRDHSTEYAHVLICSSGYHTEAHNNCTDDVFDARAVHKHQHEEDCRNAVHHQRTFSKNATLQNVVPILFWPLFSPFFFCFAVALNMSAPARALRHIQGRLDARTTQLAAIAGYTASGNLSTLAKVWAELPESDHAAGSEVVLQNIATNGIPRTLMGLTTITEVGVKDRLIVDNWPSTAEQRKGFHEAGLETIKTLYGHKHLRYQDRVRALHPAYGHWCIDFMYGRVRSRPGIQFSARTIFKDRVCMLPKAWQCPVDRLRLPTPLRLLWWPVLNDGCWQ